MFFGLLNICMPARFYGTLKTHEPEKSFPMRAIVLIIGSPPYGKPKFLVNTTAYLK